MGRLGGPQPNRRPPAPRPPIPHSEGGTRLKSFERMLMSIVLTAGLVAGTIPSAAHSGCLRWPFSGGVLSLQHYVGYVDFGSYPEYRDAINDWNQPATRIWFYDG